MATTSSGSLSTVAQRLMVRSTPTISRHICVRDTLWGPSSPTDAEPTCVVRADGAASLPSPVAPRLCT